jgi:hypothetical protein
MNDEQPQALVIEGDTCFSAHMRYGVQCPKTECRYWMPSPSSQNCSLIAASVGGMTLEQIGQIFGLTRMRVCQIEKSIYKKIVTQLMEHQP